MGALVNPSALRRRWQLTVVSLFDTLLVVSRAVTVCAQSASKDVVVYNGSGNLRIEVRADANTVWLNRQQLALMFGRDVKTIGKHIANALKEELRGIPVVAKFATVQIEGGRTATRQVGYRKTA